MRAAIASARLGDEQLGEGPTVLELEERSAVVLGQEAAVFLPTATMANQGLGCPLGAPLAGSEAKILQARRAKHLFGGAMRQAGIVAAAGIYAVDHNVERIADDHARARRLAERLAQPDVTVDLEQVETNFVHIDVGPYGSHAMSLGTRKASRRRRPCCLSPHP